MWPKKVHVFQDDDLYNVEEALGDLAAACGPRRAEAIAAGGSDREASKTTGESVAEE